MPVKESTIKIDFICTEILVLRKKLRFMLASLIIYLKNPAKMKLNWVSVQYRYMAETAFHADKNLFFAPVGLTCGIWHNLKRIIRGGRYFMKCTRTVVMNAKFGQT